MTVDPSAARPDARAALRAALRGPLPGALAQSRMRPAWSAPPRAERWRESAVLVLLYPGPAGPSFPLLLRSEGLAHHGGQVGLPGGSREAGEELSRTAVRETEEEIGVPGQRIELLGALTPLRVSRSGFEIAPFVGWTPERPAFSLQAGEVAGLIEAELARLIDPESATEAEVETGDGPKLAPGYLFGGRVVWGATAMILAELAALLSPALPTR